MATFVANHRLAGGFVTGNAERAVNVISTAEAALEEVSTLLHDLRGLIVESANTGAFQVLANFARHTKCFQYVVNAPVKISPGLGEIAVFVRAVRQPVQNGRGVYRQQQPPL